MKVTVFDARPHPSTSPHFEGQACETLHRVSNTSHRPEKTRAAKTRQQEPRTLSFAVNRRPNAQTRSLTRDSCSARSVTSKVVQAPLV